MNWMRSIRAKTAACFFLLLLVLLSSLLIFYRISMKNVESMATESMVKTLDMANADIYQVLAEAKKMAYAAAQDGEIQLSLRKDLPAIPKDMYKQRLNFNYQLRYMNQLSENVDGIFVIGSNGAIYRSSGKTLFFQDFRKESWYRKVYSSGDILWMAPREGSFMVNNLDTITLSVVVPIMDRISTKVLGVVVADVLAEDIQGISSNGVAFDGSTYILNRNNEVIYSSDLQDLHSENIQKMNSTLAQLNLEKESVTKEIEIDGGKYLLASMTVDINDWKIVQIISYENIYSKVDVMEKTMTIAIAVFVFLSAVFSVVITLWISKPIDKMKKTMKIIERGNFDVRINDISDDELGELSKNFNVMISKIQQLTKNEQKNQEKLRKAELNALQAQINPHFLYNTLESIKWMSRMNRISKVEEMIDALSTLFRISLSKGRIFITIQEEITHVEKYIQIQKIRYDRIMDYSIDIPENLYPYQTVKIILQPLVENAIYHGIKEKGEPGHISITARETEAEVIFCVQDTGIGMTEKKLKELQEMMGKGIAYDPKSYGIINVQERIQMHYGPEYGLHFESVYGEGTKVFVTIPKRGRDDTSDQISYS